MAKITLTSKAEMKKGVGQMEDHVYVHVCTRQQLKFMAKCRLNVYFGKLDVHQENSTINVGKLVPSQT